MDQSGATRALNRCVRVAPRSAADRARYVLATLAHFLLKPSTLQPSEDAKASLQLTGETA